MEITIQSIYYYRREYFVIELKRLSIPNSNGGRNVGTNQLIQTNKIDSHDNVL